MGMGSSFCFFGGGLGGWRQRSTKIYFVLSVTLIQPSGFSETHFHSCVLRVWPEPAAAHPPMAEGGWLKAICPPFRVSPDICWLTWGCQRGPHFNTATGRLDAAEKSENSRNSTWSLIYHAEEKYQYVSFRFLHVSTGLDVAVMWPF